MNVISNDKTGKAFKGMEEYITLAKKISSGDASISDKRSFLKLFYEEMAKGEKDGRFIKSWYDNYRKSLGGWTNDVLNKDLLNRN